MIFGCCCCSLVGSCAINIEKRKKALEEEIEDQEEKSKDVKPLFCVKKANPSCQRKQQKSTAFLVRIIGLRTKKEGIFRFWSKFVFRVGQRTNFTISNIKFKVAHCVVVYALSFSRNWLKVFFLHAKVVGLSGINWWYSRNNGYCVVVVAEKSVNSRQRWKQVIFRCNISKLCFILPSLQYKLRRFFCVGRGRTPVDWTKQRKATSALSICVLQNYIHGFCWLLFFHFISFDACIKAVDVIYDRRMSF